MHDDRGVSDVIGFTIVAGLLLTSVALVSATAFTQLDAARDAEQRENVVRAFTVLEDNIDDIAVGQTSRRGTEVNLGDGQLGFGDRVKITVEGNSRSLNVTTTPLVYVTPGGDRVVYTSGAVLRDLPDGSTMVDDPDWYQTTQDSQETASITIIDTQRNGRGPVGVGGGTRSVITTNDPEGENVTTLSDPETIEINGTTSPGAWERYCQDEGFLSVDSVSGDTVVCKIESNDRVIVNTKEVRVLLD